MEEKKCPECGYALQDGEVLCPSCGMTLSEDKEPEIAENTDDNIPCANPEEVSGEAVEDNEPVKVSKTLKILCIAMGTALAVLAAVFLWSNFFDGEINVLSFGIEDVSGKYTDDIYGTFMDFTLDEKTYEIPVTLSDGSIASDGSTQKKEFDGIYESGYSDKYIKGAIISTYISENGLDEEYKAYLNEQKLLRDDFHGFAKLKAISEDDLKEIDEKYGLTSQGKGYTSNGYWDYDSKNKEITVYDASGAVYTNLYVKKEGLVSREGYMTGNAWGGKKLNATFTWNDERYGLSEFITLYKDGNCITKAIYDDGTAPQMTAGTYRADRDIVELTFGEQTMSYRRVGRGLGFMVYTK